MYIFSKKEDEMRRNGQLTRKLIKKMLVIRVGIVLPI